MSDYTLTPNLQLYKPVYTKDVGPSGWGAHLNSNADMLDSVLATGVGGRFLPLSGGTMTGPVAMTYTAAPFLTGPNGLGMVGNYQGSGYPGFANTSRMIFANTNDAIADYCDFQFLRTTSFTGGAGHISACMRVEGNYGAGDSSENWNLVSQVTNNGPGLGVAVYTQAARTSGATGGVMGAVLNAVDNTGLPSVSLQSTVGLEVDCSVQAQDNNNNAQIFGGLGNRIGVNVVAVRQGAATSPPTEVAAGLWFTTSQSGTAGNDAYSNFLSAISFGINTKAYQALDTRGAIVPTGVTDPFAAVRMAAGQSVDFNGGTSLKSVGGNYLQYTTAGGNRLRYMAGANERWSVSDAGSLVATANLGTVAAASVWTITGTAGGSGVNGPINAQLGLNINHQKAGWNATSGVAVGEIDGISVICRQGGATSDCGGVLVNVQSTGLSYLAISEGTVSNVTVGTSTITKQMGVSTGVLDGVGGTGQGVVITSNVGALNTAVQVQDTTGAGTWANVLTNTRAGTTNFTLDSSGNITTSGTVTSAGTHGTAYLRSDTAVAVLYDGSANGIQFNIGGNAGEILASGGLTIFGTKVVGTQIAGWGTPTGGSRIASFPGATATAAQTAQALAQLITDLKTHGLLGV